MKYVKKTTKEYKETTERLERDVRNAEEMMKRFGERRDVQGYIKANEDYTRAVARLESYKAPKFGSWRDDVVILL